MLKEPSESICSFSWPPSGQYILPTRYDLLSSLLRDLHVFMLTLQHTLVSDGFHSIPLEGMTHRYIDAFEWKSDNAVGSY